MENVLKTKYQHLHYTRCGLQMWHLFLGVIGFPGGAVVKNLPVNAGDTRDAALIPGSGRSPGVGNGNSLQYSFLENSMDRRAWRATAQGVSKSWTRLSMHTHMSFESRRGNNFWKAYNFSWSKIMSTIRMGLDNALSESMITPVLQISVLSWGIHQSPLTFKLYLKKRNSGVCLIQFSRLCFCILINF